jgi:hypothetical protein
MVSDRRRYKLMSHCGFVTIFSENAEYLFSSSNDIPVLQKLGSAERIQIVNSSGNFSSCFNFLSCEVCNVAHE